MPVYEDQRLLELLMLEGMQAGLSWITVLKKRDHFREAFDHFDPEKIAKYKQAKINQLLKNAGIIRNTLKVKSAIINATLFLSLQEEGVHFSDYIGQFVGGEPIQHHWTTAQQVPTTTATSDTLSNALKKRGFTFVGSTICYTFMQAAGMVNDHTTDCCRYPHGP